MRRAHRLILTAGLAALTTITAAQAPPNLDDLLARVAERVATYYKRAQSVVCTERAVVQPIGRSFSPEGFARTTEYELRVESADGDGDGPTEAKVVRRLLSVNGRAPRAKESKDRAGCTDANPLSPEPLTFLLPGHRSEYSFVSGGVGKGKDRNTLIVEFSSRKPEGNGELTEDPRGHADCFSWSVPVITKGRVWIDADSYDVVRIEERLAGPADIAVPAKLVMRYGFADWITVDRDDKAIRYKMVPFHDPDEMMLLPESIDTLTVIRSGLESIRSRRTFSDYRRFMTGGRIVK